MLLDWKSVLSDKLIFFGWSKDTTEIIEVILIINKNRIEKYEIK